MNEHTQFELSEWVTARSDDELAALLPLIEQEQAKRKAEFEREGWEEIKRVAARYGLDVSRGKRRGRTRKTDNEQRAP